MSATFSLATVSLDGKARLAIHMHDHYHPVQQAWPDVAPSVEAMRR